MKKLTHLIILRRKISAQPYSDEGYDRRLTVGSPSGLAATSQLKLIMRLAVVLTLFLTIGVGNVWGTSFTTTSSGGFSGTTDKSKTTDGITVTFSSDASWQSDHVRVYQNGTISFSCSSNITGITMNCTQGARNFTITTGGGTCSTSGSAVTWSGSGTSITLTLPSGKQVRISSIDVATGSSCSSEPTVGASSNSSIFCTLVI